MRGVVGIFQWEGCVCVCVGGGGGGGGHYVSHPSFLPCCRRNCFQTVFTDFGQPIDLKLVTLITGICKSGNLFMLILCGLFWPRISDYWCVRYYKVSRRPEMTKVTAEQLSQKLF